MDSPVIDVMDNKKIQERYWIYMNQIKFEILYLDLYADNIYKYDIAIKIFCAIASSAGIAAWAMWGQLAFIWSIIIAISQVLAAVKEFLPYHLVLKSIAASQKPFKLLYNDIEHKWLEVASGNLTEEEINELLYDFQKKHINIENELFKKGIPFLEKKIKKDAEQKTDVYFQNNF